MVFRYSNVFNTARPLSIVIEHEGQSIEFIIKSIINKNKKELLSHDKQFLVLNSFFLWKGKEFENKIFGMFQELEELLTDMTILLNSKRYFDKTITLSNQFDVIEFAEFCRFELKLLPPSDLMEEFDATLEADGRGTRVQTYTIQQYFEILGLSLFGKLLVGPLAEFLSINDGLNKSTVSEFILYKNIERAKVFDSDAAIKLRGLLDKVSGNIDNTSSFIIDKGISEEDITTNLFAIIFLKKLPVEVPAIGNKDSNVITAAYGAANNMAKGSRSNGNDYYDKKPQSSSDGDTESSFETYRKSSPISLGHIEELNWYSSDLDRLIVDLGLDEHRAFLNGVYNDIKAKYEMIPIEEVSFILASNYMHRVLDYRAFPYLRQENMIKILIACYGYLKFNGFEDIANLLMISEAVSSDMIAQSVNRTIIPKDLKEKAQLNYPKEITINQKGEVKDKDVLILTVNLVGNMFYSKIYRYLLPKEYLKGVSSKVSFKPDLKARLLDSFITLV